jgi:cold shock CspA family protein
MTDTMEDTPATVERMKGCVKWFNNKQGFGFISVTTGEKQGTDLFVHHSAIQVGKEQYKYLVQGEYVEFELCKADQASHEYQAGNVRGLDNGKLMCETRHESRLTRTSDVREGVVRGAGPREGTRAGEEWYLIKRRTGPQRDDDRRSTSRGAGRT